MSGRSFLLPAILAVAVVLAPLAQESGPSDGEVAGEAAPGGEPDPGARTPQWARDLRRAEIVATGSFPLSLLASRLVYSLARFVVKSIQAGGIDVNYAPWFIAPPGAPELLFAEKLGIVSGALTLSTAVAIIDFSIGRRNGDE